MNPPPSSSPTLEAVWRSIRRPLLSISSRKGVSDKHRGSLRTLVKDHQLVKVKFGGVRGDDNTERGKEIERLCGELLSSVTSVSKQHFIIRSDDDGSFSFICVTIPPFASHAPGSSNKHRIPSSIHRDAVGDGPGVGSGLYGRTHSSLPQHWIYLILEFGSRGWILLIVPF